MKELSADLILAIHSRITTRNGSDARIVSEANLLQMLFQANLIGEAVPRAAYVFYTLTAYPAFREENETTARELALQILSEDGYGIDPDDTPLLVELGERINAFTAEPEDIDAWFTMHARITTCK